MKNCIINNKLVLNTASMMEFLELSSILFIRGNGSYSTIMTSDQGEKCISVLIKDIEQLIASKYFIRVHKSYIININKISHIDKKNRIIVLESGFKLQISRRMKSNLINHLKMVSDNKDI